MNQKAEIAMGRFDPRQWGLQIKLPVIVVAIVYSIALFAGVIAQVRETSIVRDVLEGRARQLALALALSNSENVARTDYWTLYANLRRQVDALDQEMAPLVFGAIVTDEGVVLAHTQPDKQRIGMPLAELEAFEGMYPGRGLVDRYVLFRGKEALLASAPIEYRGKEIGFVWLGYDTDFIRWRVLITIVQIGAVATALAIIGSFLGWRFSRRMVKPIGDLTTAVEQIHTGRLDEIAPIHSHEKDEIGHLVAAFNEMAAQLQEKEALSAQLQVAEKLAAIGRMVSGVAHEINNPLGGMKNALENLRLFSRNPDTSNESMQLLESGLKQIEAVVEALLAQHRGAGMIGACNPRCLDDLFLLVRHDCELRHIRIDWRNELETQFLVPKAQLQQVLTNLLINAVGAMPEGGILTFLATERENTLVFVVEDTGSGIPQEQLDRIFEPFFTTKADGTGLGLWVSMGLVQAMGGVIEVESEPGRGTRFSIIIPKIPSETERSEEHELIHH